MPEQQKQGSPKREVGRLLGDRVLSVFTRSNGLVSLAVVLAGFLVATILILVSGRNPAGMYWSILQVVSGLDVWNGKWNVRYIGEWLALSMPLILCGLSMAFAARTGLFNIGAEGQYVAGLTAAQFVALLGPRVPVLTWVLALLAAVIAGAVWGGVVGFLKARFQVSEVVATIMLNYIALYLSRMLTLGLPGASTYKTPQFPQEALLDSPILKALTRGSRLNEGIWFTLLAVLLFWFIMEKTRLGFALRATGLNREAARASGIPVKRSITTAMAIAGAFAGLAGAIVALGSFDYGRVLSGQDGYGFDGIAVALVGNSHALGTLLAGLLFGMLKAAQPLMQEWSIPREITSIIVGLVVVFISLRSGVVMLAEWRQKELAKRGRTD